MKQQVEVEMTPERAARDAQNRVKATPVTLELARALQRLGFTPAEVRERGWGEGVQFPPAPMYLAQATRLAEDSIKRVEIVRWFMAILLEDIGGKKREGTMQ